MRKLAVLGLLLCLFCTGCAEVNWDYASGALVDLGVAASISNADLQSMAVAMRAEGDRQERVASSNSSYARRLNRLMSGHTSANGIPLNFKVYLSDTVNANASADGSIRVYSGLMDLMTDDELRYVLGHEIGHVANGDILKATRTAYMASAARQGVAALSPTAASLSESVLGDLLEAVVNAQYSQAQERAADDYSLQFLLSNNYNAQAAISALRKLDNLGSSGGGLLASHPDPGRRADRLAQALAENPTAAALQPIGQTTRQTPGQARPASQSQQASPARTVQAPTPAPTQAPARPQIGNQTGSRPNIGPQSGAAQRSSGNNAPVK